MRQLPEAVRGDEVVVFEADPGTEPAAIEPGFEGDDVALFENIVPGRIDPRHLVGVETDPVTGVVEKE